MAQASASPLLGQYAQWTMGRESQVNALPRNPLTFDTGAFGPLPPIKPIGIDQAVDGDDRPMMRRWQYPIAWNMPVGSPGTEGLKLADFQTLRLYAEIYSVARACIQLRKDEILGIGWDIGPTHDASKNMRGDSAAREDFGKRRGEMLRFFRRPDPNYNDFTAWLEAVLEDVFVIDALSIYLHPSRLPGKGVAGTNLAALDLIAGDTIRPLLDLRGGSPVPPNPAYQQYLFGVPRTDLMTVLTGDDAKDLGLPIREYRGDQLLYLPRNPRTWTPYGQAPMERCIVPVITGLRRQQYQMDYYLEGTLPGAYISVGDPDWTPNQIRELQDTLNAIAGDQAWKHKIIGLPAGSKIDPQKPPELSDQTDEVIMTSVCMAYSVLPMELGILPKVAAVQTPGAMKEEAQASANLQKRKSLKPDLLWLKSALFDQVIQSICGQHDMEWRWDNLEEDKDELTQTQLITQQVSYGLVSIDEARIEVGREPWGMEITQDPGFVTAAGFMPLGAINPDTGLPNVQEGLLPNGVTPPGGAGSQPGQSRSGTARAPGASAAQSQRTPQTQPGPRRPASGGTSGPDPVPGSRPQSPGHAAASAAEGIHATSRRPVSKAATDSELDALQRHLRKGRLISTWEARYLPEGILSGIAESMAKGMSVDEAVTVAKIAAITSALRADKHVTTPLARQVAGQLSVDYPASSLGWVLHDAEWRGPAEVPLENVDFSNRKSWKAWHEPDRVAAMEKKLRRKVRRGDHLKPAVTIDRPGTPPGEDMMVADGHHRALASLKAGEPLWAYIGRVQSATGPWDQFHVRQNTGTSENAA